MKPSNRLQRLRKADPRRRGAALMVAFLVLIVLILINYQLKTSTSTQARVSRNEQTLRTMDESIESVLLQVFEDLKADGEAAAGGAGGGEEAAAANALGGLGGGGAPGEEGGQSQATDSQEDDWARPQRTELNEVRLRILVQDECGKFNLLSILTEDEAEAEKAFERLVRVIENSRRGTTEELEPGEARRIATAMLELMNRRRDHELPKPELLSDDLENEDIGLPLSLREFAGLGPEVFPPDLFRDYRDERGQVVHSLGSFLTVWTSMATRGTLDEESAVPGEEPEAEEPEEPEGGEEPEPGEPAEEGAAAGEGGEGAGGAEAPGATVGTAGTRTLGTINVNTAPRAVLDALIDERDVPRSFWDEVIEFRNTEDEEVEENEDPPLDEYGEPIIVKKYFHTLEDLGQIDGWTEFEPIHQNDLRARLGVQSDVFSIFVTARKPPQSSLDEFELADRESLERQETEGAGLVRSVRCVVWRRAGTDGTVEIVPLVRWEVLDYVPYQVLDYPGEER